MRKSREKRESLETKIENNDPKHTVRLIDILLRLNMAAYLIGSLRARYLSGRFVVDRPRVHLAACSLPSDSFHIPPVFMDTTEVMISCCDYDFTDAYLRSSFPEMERVYLHTKMSDSLMSYLMDSEVEIHMTPFTKSLLRWVLLPPQIKTITGKDYRTLSDSGVEGNVSTESV